MTVFKSSKNYVMISLLWLIIIFLLVIPFIPEEDKNSDKLPIIGILILYFITAMLIWMLLDTRYRIREKQLFYCSGLIRGSIEIATIRKVERWNKWYVTSLLKPALGKDGLIIYYNKFDDIYISPKEKEIFITALREINPDIEVV
jgi:uncharacterized membrane protein YwaF